MRQHRSPATTPATPSSNNIASATIAEADLVSRFHAAHPDSFHDQIVIAAVIGCSEEKLERDRWAGKGLPFVKFGRLVRYRKRDVVGTPVVRGEAEQGARNEKAVA